MYNWSLAIIMRGEDGDGVTFRTTEACIFGLVDICCTASSVASTSSVIKGICSAVFFNVLTFFISTFEDKDIYHVVDKDIEKVQESTEVFSQLKKNMADDNETALSKLFKFRALSLLRIFFSCPKNLLAACFELFDSSSTDVVHKGGCYFLRQVTSQINAGEVSQSDKISDVDMSFMNSIQTPSESNDVGVEKRVSSDNHVPEKALRFSKTCLMGMVINKDPSLRGWIFSRYKKLRKSMSAKAVSEISTSLEEVFESFSELVEEADSQDDSDEDNSDPSKYINRQYLVPKISSRHDSSAEISARDGTPRVHDASSGDAFYEDGDSCDKILGQSVKRCNSVDKTRVDIQSGNGSSNHECEGSGSIKNWEVGDSVSNPLVSPTTKKPVNLRNDAYESGHRTFSVENNQVPSMRPLSVRSTNILPSPRQHSAINYHACSSSQVIWHSDGDPAAMDVFSASKQLWLGSLGHDTSETLVRMQFEKFGPIEQFLFYPLKGFALVEYRNIMDAIRARAHVRVSSPWGPYVRIRFLDSGLGSRGAINGAAVGASCHVYIGKVSSQWVKDEILYGLVTVGLRSPRMVTDLSSENALLLEFETAEEAATVMAHIRQHRKENGYQVTPIKTSTLSGGSSDGVSYSRHLLVRQIDQSVPDEELINAFSGFGEITGWKFMRQSSCCFIDFHSADAASIARSHLDCAKFGPTSIRVEFRFNTPGNLSNSMIGSPIIPTVLDSPIDSSKARMSQLSSLISSLYAKYKISQCSSSVDGYISRNKHTTALSDEDIVPTNTLWIGLPDINSPFLTDDELMAICNLAVGNVGSIVRLTRSHMHQGSRWFVEFSSVDAAISVLKNIRACSGTFLQIEFRNSGNHLHPNEHQPSIMKTESSIHELVSPRIKMENHGIPLQSGHAFQSNWAVSSNTPMVEVGSIKIEKVDNFENKIVADLSLAEGRAVSHSEQMWMYKKPEIELQMSAPGSIPCPPVPTATQGGNNFPPQMQPSSFMQPVYPTPNNSWDMHGLTPYMPLNQISSHTVPNNFHVNGPGVAPFLPPSVTPLTQLPRNPAQHFEQMVNLPALPPLTPPPPPPPDMPPPLPPSPPPLPMSQPPVVPPPPSSPPPFHQQVVEPSSLENSGPRFQYQWQGALCKSGVQYCTIYASRADSVSCKYTNSIFEPAEWPAKLDVTKRTDFRHVKSTFNSTPPHKREICRLLPSTINDHKGFQDFISYLKQRECAGVIKIPEGKSVWARLLFILPYSLDTCTMLSIAPHPDECLIALVVPKETNSEWGP
ncbi:nucleic acid binding protein isoform X2 [Tasmannia lanceolata]